MRDIRAVVGLAAAIGLLIAATNGAQAETATLKLAAFLPEQSVSGQHVLKPYIAAVEREAGNAVKIETYFGGTLGRDPAKQYKLVTDGVADIAYVVNFYSSGQFPDTTIGDLPYLFKDAQEGSIALWRLYEKGLLAGFGDIKTLGMWMSDFNGIHARRPFKTLEDLKGMKIRASGPVAALFLKQFGAVPVSMDATKVTEAINSGVVDGLTQSWVGLVTFRTHNVVNYHYEGTISTTVFILAMNKQKWESLDAPQKAALDKHGGGAMARLGGGAFDREGRARFNQHKGEPGRVVVVPTESDIKAAEKYFKPVYEEWVEKTADGKKKLDTMRLILADIRAGK